MRRFLLGLGALACLVCRATESEMIEVLPDYLVVGITRIGDAPANVVVRAEDGKFVRSNVGGKIGDYDVTGVTLLGDEKFIEVRKGEVDYLIALKRPENAPFMAGPLADAFNGQLITREGRLTNKGRARITNNLRQFASAGQQYILEEGKVSAGNEQLEGIYFKKLTPIIGEDYSKLVVSENGGKLIAKTLFGEEVEFAY